MKSKNKKAKSLLMQISKLKGTQEDIASAAEITEPTLRLYLNDPKSMTGFAREKLCKALAIPSPVMNLIIDGKIRSMEEFFNAKEALKASDKQFEKEMQL